LRHFLSILLLPWSAAFTSQGTSGFEVNFAGDLAFRLRGNANEFNADANTRKAMTHFAASLHFGLRVGQPETKVQNCPFREDAAGADEHSTRAQIRRPDVNLFIATLV